MKTVVFHPSVSPFVQQVALAFHEKETLTYFASTIINDEDSNWQNSVHRLCHSVGFDFRSLLRRRKVEGIKKKHLKSYPFAELIRLAVGKVDKKQVLTDMIWEWSERGFDRRVAQALVSEVETVYGYEHSSEFAFEEAKKTKKLCVYELPSVEPTFVHELLEKERSHFPQLQSSYSQHIKKQEARRTARRNREWNLADLIIVNSEFTKSTFAKSGRDMNKVKVIPYGCPTCLEKSEVLPYSVFQHEPLKLIWAGTFGIRKGAHYLLKAWDQGEFSGRVQLDVYGTVSLPESLLEKREGIFFHSPISRDELLSQFRKADALLFPTLCDGFGMVGSEALSQGLPVITTKNAGVSHLIEDKSHGLVIPAGDEQAIMEVFEWCLSHREYLYEMREKCLLQAGQWQWKDYRKKIYETVVDSYTSAASNIANVR